MQLRYSVKKLMQSMILPFIVLAVSPITFYYNNINEITFSLSDIWLPILLLFSLSTLFLLILHIVIGRFSKLVKFYSGLLVGLALASWVQSQLFIWKFGLLNGGLIDWSVWSVHMWFEGLTWGVILISCIYVFMSNKDKLSKLLLLFVYGIGLVSVVSTYVVALENPKMNEISANKKFEELFHLHSKNNVFIIMLDTFQSDYFDLISREYPEEIAALDGFTFYRNTISRYPTTACSLPSIVTGKLYDNNIPYKDYLKTEHGSFDLSNHFASMNYSSEHVGPGPIVPGGLHMGTVVNEYAVKITASWAFYIDYGLLRLSPTLFKKYIYNNGNWLFSFLMRKDYPPDKHGEDVRFLELFENKTIVSDGNNEGVYRFLHFYIPHPRWYVDENLRYDTSLSGAAAYYRQTRGAIKLVERILQKLHSLGIYDSSEIVVMGDHGTQSIPPLSAKVTLENIFDRIPFTTCSSSLALMLHKKPGSTGPLVINEAPLCTSDLPCLLGVENEIVDCSEFNSAMQGATRRRRFLDYKWSHEYWKKDYMPPMTEYFVEGHAYDFASWQKANFRFEDGKKIPLAPEAVKIGVPVVFKSSEAPDIFRNGWSAQEKNHRWTDGPLAGMELNVQDAQGKDLLLRLYATGFSPQVIGLQVNDQQIATWQVDGYKWYEAFIPADVVGDGILKVIFTISNPTAPCEVGKSRDCRKLGLAAKKMVVETK